jgi:hypothetical protein
VEVDAEWLTSAADHVVFSKNIHETRAYNKLAGMARAPVLFFVQDDDAPPAGAHTRPLLSSTLVVSTAQAPLRAA